MDQPTPERSGTVTGLRTPPPAPPQLPERRGRRRRARRPGRVLLVPLLSAFLGGGMVIGALFGTGVLPTEPPTTVVQREVIRTEVVRPEQPFRTATQIAEEVVPSVVQVLVTSETGQGSGSGVVYRADGHVVTNEHVVRNATGIQVVFADGRIYPAEVVGVDAHTDLAVIRVPTTDLKPIGLGSTETARLGDPAIAVGSPLGLDGGPSVTVGVISAFDRPLNVPDGRLFGMLQTDAPITRGSSGGALVDPHGRLLGITTAIAVSDLGAEGLGFAIPVEVVRRVADDLIDRGEVLHAFLGIEGITIFEQEPDGAEVPAGARIERMLPDSAIGQSGARVGDVIVALEEEPIATMEELVVELRRYRAGDEVRLTVLRNAEMVLLDVTLDRRPDDL